MAVCRDVRCGRDYSEYRRDDLPGGQVARGPKCGSVGCEPMDTKICRRRRCMRRWKPARSGHIGHPATQ